MQRTSKSFAAVLLAVALVSCGSDEAIAPPVQTPNGTVTLRVINAGSTMLSVYVDNAVKGSNIAIASVAPTISIPAGSHQVRLVGTDGSSSTVSINTKDGDVVTAVGTRTSTTGLTASVIADTGAIVPAGKSKLRVLHLSPNAGDIEIWRTQPDFQTPVHIMTPFPYMGQSPYLQSDPGNWEVFITAAGSTAKLVSTGAVNVPSGERRTVVLLDSAGSRVFRVIAQ